MRLERATAVEIDKQLRLNALGRVVAECDLPEASIVVDALVLYKLKADGRETCRIAAMGNRLPPLPSCRTYASVVSDGAKMFAVASMQAYCEQRAEPLIISDADVVGGFLHIPLNPPVPMFLRLPVNLPHPLAGQLVEILHALYGLQESNRLFSVEMARVLVSDAGFLRSTVEPQAFVRFAPDAAGHKCIAVVTVDDVLVLSNDQVLVASLFSSLSSRFGPLTINPVTAVHTGLEFTQLSNAGVLITQDQPIARAASLYDVAHLPPVDIPAPATFFHLPVDSLECAPVNSALYSSFTGMLVQFLKTRHDIRLFVSYLCSFNSSPLEYHYRLAILLLRYLHSTPGVGCLFKSCGGVLCATSDAAFGLYPDGRSSGAHILSIGPDNAPFACSAKVQSCVATCPMTAEYYSAGSACQDIEYYRQLSADLGWSCLQPTVLTMDNKTAISLATAPRISRRSRHIVVKHHYIRELVAAAVVCCVYAPSSLMRVNVLTKCLPRGRFIIERDVFLNRACFYPLP